MKEENNWKSQDGDFLSIAIIIYKFSKSGGVRVLSKLAEMWEKAGHRVSFICMDKRFTPYFPITSKVIYVSKGGNKKKFLDCTSYMTKHFAEYDMIISNFCLTVFPAYFAALLNRNFKKLYYYIQAYEPDFFPNNRILRILAKFSYRLPFTRIVNSKTYYDICKADKFVPPGLDLDIYYPKNYTFFSKKLKIGTIGRKEEWKGTAIVCKAMELLKAEGINFDFYIAFNDFDTCEHVFISPDGDEKLASFYRDMDIIVAACTAQAGAIHYPIIESMAVGTTIICTNYYPADETNSYKVRINSPEEIAFAVKKVLENKEEAIEKRSKAIKDVQQFSWNIVAEQFLKYLMEK